MKSRITIEVDFENGNKPVIQILKQNSDDVRDNLIQSFLHSFIQSGLCKIQWKSSNDIDGTQRIHISPLGIGDMPDLDSTNKEQLAVFFHSGEVRGSGTSKYYSLK
jgi:hypothetical protein